MVFPHSYRTEHTETITSNSMYGDHTSGPQKKIKIQPELLKVIQTIERYRDKYKEHLADIIKIQSVTSDITYTEEVKKMVQVVEKWLKQLGMKFEIFHIGHQKILGKEVKLPPVILASLGNDPKKKSICAYAHLDVPMPKVDDWDTDPWVLTVKDNNIYGNGVGCGKGPFMCWMLCIQAFQMNQIPLPINFRLCVELMHHQNSQGLSAFVNTKKQDFFNQIDFVADISGEWIGPKVPCIIYGTVGFLHMDLTIEGDSVEALKQDMIKICDTMVSKKMEITIPHFSDTVAQIGPDEERVYEKIKEFNPKEIRNSLPEFKRGWDKVRLLMHFWRLPAIFLDDVEECNCKTRDKNMIRRRIIFKIVPRQTIDYVTQLFNNHMNSMIKKLGIKNKVQWKCVFSLRPWVENHNSSHHMAAKKAITQIYKAEPSLIREDIGRETTAIFDSVLEKNLVILPICSKGSNLGKANEHISTRFFLEAIKLVAAYMFQVALIKPNPKAKPGVKAVKK